MRKSILMSKYKLFLERMKSISLIENLKESDLELLDQVVEGVETNQQITNEERSEMKDVLIKKILKLLGAEKLSDLNIPNFPL